MRVTKNSEGTFVVEDEPMRLDGQDAERFLADMKARDAEAPTSARDRFKEECASAYRRTLLLK